MVDYRILLSTAVLAALSPMMDACLSSGVCGGGGFCGAPAPLPCQASSCQPGYTCGQYGCARNRARSALTQKISGIFIGDGKNVTKGWDNQEKGSVVAEHNIYGMRRGAAKIRAPTPIAETNAIAVDNSTLDLLLNPNYIFRQCCEQRGLPDACLSKCNFNNFNKDALQAMYFKQDGCPLEATADMQFCAAQGGDHRECCARNGVATTLAGEKCLVFCDQRPDKITKLDYSYVPCYDRFENIKRCFYNDVREKAEKQFGKYRN